jgi:hypothetical protein
MLELLLCLGFSCGCCGHGEKLPSESFRNYRFGCGSGGTRCQRIAPDGTGPVYDYRTHFNYPWLPYRRPAAAPPGWLPPMGPLPEVEPEIIRLEP